MTESITNEIKLIVFQLKDKEYAIPVSHVNSIEKIEHITRVPNVSPHVKGVINLRGVVTPIIDLRTRFGFEEVPYSDRTRIIIVSVDQMEVGLIVDGANDVIDIHSHQIEPQPEVVGGVENAFIEGVVKVDNRLLILLDLEKVLEKEEVSGQSGSEGK